MSCSPSWLRAQRADGDPETLLLEFAFTEAEHQGALSRCRRTYSQSRGVIEDLGSGLVAMTEEGS
jgi:hypothetical protein